MPQSTSVESSTTDEMETIEKIDKPLEKDPMEHWFEDENEPFPTLDNPSIRKKFI
jgi:hypothetical protein